MRRNRLREEWGVTEHDMQSILNAGAVDLIVATIDAGRRRGRRPQVVDGRAGPQRQRARASRSTSCRSPRRRWPGSRRWSPPATLNDKLARQVIEGVLAGEGTPDEVVEKRGLKVVSDEGALGTAVDEAIAGNAAIADKIRGGKVAAVGALVGAVMKATRGQADAARVKELILEQLGVSEG